MAFPFVRQMGSETKSHNKRHYDISMSRRTRRPAKIQDELQIILAPNNDGRNVDNDKDRFESATIGGFEKIDDDDHKSLQQLMVNGKGKAEARSDESGRGRNSLGQHFSKEEINNNNSNNNNNNLQIVKKQHQDGLQGVKLKKVVGNFLRNLIRGGSDQHQLKKPRKKPFL